MLADWMLTLRERIDHHARLMPYALSALSDPSKDVQRAALKLMDDLGVQYEEEHQQDLKVPHSLLCWNTCCPVWEQLVLSALSCMRAWLETLHAAFGTLSADKLAC